MNISKESLNALRIKLEEDYDKLEKEIVKLSSRDNKKTEIEKKVQLQTMIDEQLDYIDNIINYLDKVPRLYEKLLRVSEKYDQIVGV